MHALRPRSDTGKCRNLNHGRGKSAPVAHCPDCGELINAARSASGCPEPAHVAARRRQVVWCTACGERLITTFLK